MNILEYLLKAIRSAARYNKDVEVAPDCILWPDHDRQWETVIPTLQAEMPELFVLGKYAPDKRTGPAIWLRCVLAGQIPDISLPEGSPPVLYLPGVSRQDLRAVESCPEHLKALAELQYTDRRLLLNKALVPGLRQHGIIQCFHGSLLSEKRPPAACG